jgi:atypical dual specificity phosphatase
MSDSIPNFGFVFEDKIAGSAHPGSGRLLIEGLTRLKDQGFAAILSLTEEPLERPVLREFGFSYEHVPVPDFYAPTLEQIVRAVEFIEAHRGEGAGVLVHCTAGQGRTGTILAAFLVGQGMSAEEAIATVRQLRPGSIETLEQEHAVQVYERHLKEAAAPDDE